MARETIPDRLVRNASEQGGRPAIWSKRDSAWTPLTWADYLARCRAFGGALLELGYEPGGVVAIMGENSAEWIIADVGAMFVRGVAAGIYQTSTPEQAAYVAGHCEARVVVVEDEAQWKKLALMRDELPHLKRVVVINGGASIEDPMVVCFDAFLESGRGRMADVDARLAAVEPDDLATLIYTSGTTGPPKGVMLSHRNLAWTADIALQIVGGAQEGDCVVSYLPLSHIAEQMFSIHVAITTGYPIWIAGGLDYLKETLVQARPSIFMGVPRVWEKFKAALEVKLGGVGGVKGAIVNWSRAVGAEAGPRLFDEGALSGGLALKYRVADKLFFSKLKAQLGFDRMKVAVSGAAPIGRDVVEFFCAMGIPIHEVYGQSEDAGPTTFNQPFPGKRRLGTVGRPLPGVQVEIADDGEIRVRGPNVFLGYYKEEAATAATLVDGWLHSGDVGELDADGFLRITDRKKDLIITAGGKNVAPQNIEKLLKRIDGIGQAVVIGDRRRFLAALLTLDPERAPALAQKRGWPTDPKDLARSDAFRDYIQTEVDRLNGELARYETIKKFTLLPDDFTQETGELTPTQKVRRKVVSEKYAQQIEAFYAT